jgi:hypothetical protein
MRLQWPKTQQPCFEGVVSKDVDAFVVTGKKYRVDDEETAMVPGGQRSWAWLEADSKRATRHEAESAAEKSVTRCRVGEGEGVVRCRHHRTRRFLVGGACLRAGSWSGRRSASRYLGGTETIERRDSQWAAGSAPSAGGARAAKPFLSSKAIRERVGGRKARRCVDKRRSVVGGRGCNSSRSGVGSSTTKVFAIYLGKGLAGLGWLVGRLALLGRYGVLPAQYLFAL